MSLVCDNVRLFSVKCCLAAGYFDQSSSSFIAALQVYICAQFPQGVTPLKVIYLVSEMYYPLRSSG